MAWVMGGIQGIEPRTRRVTRVRVRVRVRVRCVCIHWRRWSAGRRRAERWHGVQWRGVRWLE